MGLEHHRVDRLRRGDGDQRGARRIEEGKAGAKDIEGADQVDVHHGLEAVGGHAQRRRDKVAGRARDHDVDRAEFVARARECRFHRGVVAHIGRHANSAATGINDAGRRRGNALGVAADQRQAGARLGEVPGDAQVDAGRGAGDEHDLAGQDVVFERVGHGFPSLGWVG